MRKPETFSNLFKLIIGANKAAPGRSMLNGGADTTGQSELGGRVTDGHGVVAAPSAVAARDSAAPR